MNNNLVALDKLINDASTREQELAEKGEQLALQSKEFASYLAEKKRLDDELDVLWGMVKDYMIDNNIMEHDTDFISLKLTPSGKYKAENIAEVDDELCDIKKTLNNSKVKAYFTLHNELPSGVKSTGYILRKKIKGE